MGQTQGVTDLVLGHSEEIHPGLQLRGVGSPVLVLVKVNVSTELGKLVRIVGVGEDQARSVERVTGVDFNIMTILINEILNLSP